MNEKDFDIRRIIKETFKDDRSIKCRTPEDVRKLDDGIHPGGEIFTTEDDEFIDFELQLRDFDEEELVKYIEFAENLYEKHHKRVSVYLLCPKDVDVSVRECTIKSESDFTIKLACSREGPCHLILNGIKNKLKNNDVLDEDDLYALAMLPVRCDRKDRNYFRLEYLKIINRYFY
jgi:hypothetical protein